MTGSRRFHMLRDDGRGLAVADRRLGIYMHVSARASEPVVVTVYVQSIR